jgi:DNA-binding transcriptional LysR family regulator
MNLRQIEIFAAVMKLGTASRAAEQLGVTQPAVSRAIAELERSVRFTLFARVRSRLIPTPEANLFYKDVQASFRGLDTLRAGAARIRDQGSGEIRVASLSALASSLVPKAIRRFRDMHPLVRVTLHVLWSRDIRDRVASGQFDVGLAADEIDTSGVFHQPFVSPRAFCAIPLDHALSAREVITPADLQNEPIIAYVPEDRGRQRMDMIFDDAGVVPNIVAETIFAATICSLVSQGIGVGFVSPYAVGGVDCSRIALRRFEPPLYIKSLLILPLDRPKSQLVRDFIDCLMAER